MNKEKLFEIEGHYYSLSQFLHSNTDPACPPLEEKFIRRILDMKVGEVIDDYDPHFAPVKRIR